MKRLIPLILFFLCLPDAGRAELTVTGSPVMWFTNGDIQRFSRGFTGFGASGRLSWSFRSGKKISPVVFFDYSHLLMSKRQKEYLWKPKMVSIGGIGGVRMYEEFLKMENDLSMDIMSPGMGIKISGDPVSASFDLFTGISHNIISSQPNLLQLADYNTARYQTLPLAKIEHKNSTMNFGFGTHVDINLWKREEEKGFQALREFSFSSGLTYIFGGETEMVDALSIRQEEGELVYRTFKGSMNFLQMRFGFQLGL